MLLILWGKDESLTNEFVDMEESDWRLVASVEYGLSGLVGEEEIYIHVQIIYIIEWIQ